MKKRLLGFLLVLVLLVATLPLTALADGVGLDNFSKGRSYPAGKFTDVASDKWFYDNVICGYEYGLIDGRTEDSYAPDLNITYAEVIKLTACLHSIYNTGTTNFVHGDPWYQVYVDYLVDAEVLPASMRDTSFYPNLDAHRSYAADLFSLVIPENEFPAINIVEDDAIPDVDIWYHSYDSVFMLYEAGILTGKDEVGTFGPESSILRSEVAAILSRIIDVSLRERFTLRNPDQIVPSVNYVELRVGESATVMFTATPPIVTNATNIDINFDTTFIKAEWNWTGNAYAFKLDITAHAIGTSPIVIKLNDGNYTHSHTYIRVNVV